VLNSSCQSTFRFNYTLWRDMPKVIDLTESSPEPEDSFKRDLDLAIQLSLQSSSILRTPGSSTSSGVSSRKAADERGLDACDNKQEQKDLALAIELSLSQPTRDSSVGSSSESSLLRRLEANSARKFGEVATIWGGNGGSLGKRGLSTSSGSSSKEKDYPHFWEGGIERTYSAYHPTSGGLSFRSLVGNVTISVSHFSI
jgi:hypothetical protein